MSDTNRLSLQSQILAICFDYFISQMFELGVEFTLDFWSNSGCQADENVLIAT